MECPYCKVENSEAWQAYQVWQRQLVLAMPNYPLQPGMYGVPAHGQKRPCPMVSQTTSNDLLTNKSPYFFHLAPSNNIQSIAGATYAEQTFEAMLALLKGYAIALDTKQKSIMLLDLQLALRKVKDANAVQDVSRQIAFGSDGDPIEKVIVVLSVNPQGFIQMEPTPLGRFLL